MCLLRVVGLQLLLTFKLVFPNSLVSKFDHH
jgi:hypothetical protein